MISFENDKDDESKYREMIGNVGLKALAEN